MSPASPYPGLRSFDRNEAEVFFGRDRCLDGMAQTLQDTRFLAVLGPSGGGKSSLVRSGLFMHLEAGLAPKAGSRWTFLDIRHPRTRPFRELALATLECERQRRADLAAPDDGGAAPVAAVELPTEAELQARREELRNGPLALVRWWRDCPHHPNENLLLLVDQFEELFGYTKPEERKEVEAFVDLLLRTAANEELDIYVVLTMRSEFLGGCSLFPGLAEQINRSLSLTPRMTRDECKSAITGPAYGEEALTLEPLLVKALLNDMNSLAQFDEPEVKEGAPGEAVAELRQTDLIARRADQLPLMQHVLNWMWTLAANAPGRGPDQPIVLTLDDYLELGGLRGALSKHAHDVMEATGETELTSRIFRALTDQPTVATSGSAESSAVRRRRTLGELVEETGASEDRVRAVVDAYRAEGVSMLTPDATVPLAPDTVVDITHESLIRQWADLRLWIRNEAEAGRSWQELLRDVGKGKQLRGLDLSERLGWWARARPHAGWAARYGGEFEAVDRSLAADSRAARRRKLALRAATAGLVGAGLLSGASVVATQRARDTAARATTAAEEKAEFASRKAENARRMQETALRSQEAALRSASRLRTMAEKSQADAQRAAAAAEATKVDAARRMQLANAQVEAARVTAQRLSEQSHQLTVYVADNLHRARIRAIVAQTVDANDALPVARKGIEDLRPMSEPLFAALTAELYRARGDARAARLDASGMLQVADEMNKAVAEDTGHPGPEGKALILGEASVLRGRALRLQGDDAAARAAFEEAIRSLDPAGPAPVRQALADAHLQRAEEFLDSADPAAASKAASVCLDLLSADPEPGDDALGMYLTQGRCLTVAGAAAPTDEDARARWTEAASKLGAIETDDPRVQLAHWDLLIRYFRRFPKDDLEKMPKAFESTFERLEQQAFNFEGLLDVRSGASAPPELPPLEAIQRVRAVAAVAQPFVGTPDSDEFLPLLLSRSKELLTAAESGVSHEDLGAIGLISATYAEDTAIRISMLKSTAESNFQVFGDVAADASASILAHDAFLELKANVAETNRVAGGPARTAGELRARRLPALREQAHALLEAAGPTVKWQRYAGPKSLSAIADRLVARLCPQGAAAAQPGCPQLSSEAAEVKAAVAATTAQTIAAAALDRAPREAGIWADAGGVALGGLDPVSCFVGGRGIADQLRQLLAMRTGAQPSAGGVRGCAVEGGRYPYHVVWQGRLWLFEAKDNASEFQRSPERFLPQLGGNDLVAAAGGTIRPPDPAKAVGLIVGGKLYLTDTELPPAEVTDDDVAKAEAAWAAARPGSAP